MLIFHNGCAGQLWLNKYIFIEKLMILSNSTGKYLKAAIELGGIYVSNTPQTKNKNQFTNQKLIK